jgi:hypothetical protein
VLVARRIEQVSSLRWIQIEEDAGHNDDLLFQASFEEVQAIVDTFGQRRQVEPQVEGAVGDEWDLEAHRCQSVNDIVSLLAEVMLQSTHLVLDFGGLKHGDGSLLEGNVGASVEVRSTRADGLDEFLGSDDPGNSPARKTETLCQTVDDQNVCFVLERIVGCQTFLDIPSSSTSSMLSAAETTVPSQSLV